LEAAKPALREGDARTRATLATVLEGVLTLLHPIIPFVTSELWAAVGRARGEGERVQLAASSWPLVDPLWRDEGAERDFARLQAAVAAVRALRVDADLPPGQLVPVVVAGLGGEALLRDAALFASLARVTVLTESAAGAALQQPVGDLLLRLPLAGVVDVAAWRARQLQRLKTEEASAQRSRGKLGNERFVGSAPAAVVEEERRRLAEAERAIVAIEASLAQVGEA